MYCHNQIITKFDTAKFRLAGMKEASLELLVQECDNEVQCDSISSEYSSDCCLEMKPGYGGTDGSQTQQENNTTIECSICLEVLEPGEKLS